MREASFVVDILHENFVKLLFESQAVLNCVILVKDFSCLFFRAEHLMLTRQLV